MNKQKIVNKSRSYAATLAAGEVTSLRIKEDEKTVVRVYDGGKIGVAGRIGEGDDKALEKQAEEALSQNIPYPDALGSGEKRHEDICKGAIAEDDFLPAAKRLAARLKERFPDFIFSDKFAAEQMESTYRDNAWEGLHGLRRVADDKGCRVVQHNGPRLRRPQGFLQRGQSRF